MNSDFQPDREFHDRVIEEPDLGEFDYAFL